VRNPRNYRAMTRHATMRPMSLWLRAFCTKSLADVTFEQLSSALRASDFAMMAENHDLEDEVGYAAEKSLRFEQLERTARQWAVLVHYELDGKPWWMRFDLWTDAEMVRGEVAEMLENEVPERARELLPRVVETGAFDLKLSDVEGMGLPIAYELAMWLAAPERGDGLVEYEDAWWDPSTWQQL
jgi:hypothetical protein